MAKKITKLPDAPQRSQPATFRERADAMSGALQPFADEANALADEAESNALKSETFAGESETFAGESETARDASRASELGSIAAQGGSEAAAATSKWAAGDYAEGAKVWSPADYMTYRAKGAHTSTTDPSQDKVNWAMVGSFPAPFIPERFVEITDTAADYCIYDTSEDSDGGAWRDRCQHLSWYKENGEFPVPAVLSLENDTLKIHRGDDPALPEWGIIPAETGRTFSSVDARNGVIVIGTEKGPTIADFLSGTLSRTNSAGRKHELDFSTGQLIGYTDGHPGVVHDVVNDVVTPVLPGAPIDPATGLPRATVIVGTGDGTNAGGVSIIRPDGTVTNITFGSVCLVGHVAIREGDNALCVVCDTSSSGRFRRVYHDLPDADIAENNVYTIGSADELYPMYFSGWYTGTSIPLSSFVGMWSVGFDGYADGGSSQLSLIAPNPESPTEGMLAAITSEFNTGWMPGDIKGAWLCGKDDTDLVEGQYATSEDADWSTDGPSTFSGGVISVADHTANELIYNAGAAPFPKEFGAVIKVEIANSTANVGPRACAVNPLNGSILEVSTANYITAEGVHYMSISPGLAVDWVLGFQRIQSHTGTLDLQNYELNFAELDRSHNKNGIIVHGTITKESVAPGAETMAYSGFDNNPQNYLMQPYNPDLDFGTGDFYILGWMNNAGIGSTSYILDRAGPGEVGNSFRLNRKTSSGDMLFQFTVADQLLSSDSEMPVDQWAMFTAVRRGSDLEVFINGRANGSKTVTIADIDSDQPLFVGINRNLSQQTNQSGLSRLRIGGGAPSPDQIRKIYEDEKHLFADNAACTLYGTSDAVNAIAHDKRTGIRHVGTADGRSDFQGLVRVANTTVAVDNAIAAHGGLIVES